MPISVIEWQDGRRIRGYDIHLLRGHGASIRLDQQFLVFGPVTDPTTGTVSVRGFHPGSIPPEFGVDRVDFAPRFPGLTGQGVSVDLATGVVDTTAATPLNLRNFLVSASVHHNTAGLPNPLVTFIRVHVHTSVSKAWLTPTTLTVHKDARPPDKVELFKFTLLAQFDDGTIGNITDLPGITWTPTPGSGQPAVVLPTGEIRIDSFPSDVKVRATLPVAWGSTVAEGTVLARGPWANVLATPAAQLRSGPGFDRFNEVPNVLFIPDGFLDTPEDRDAFEELLTKGLDTIRRSKIARPFDLFFNSHQQSYTDSINYWSVFLPSRERAYSVLPEMRLAGQPEVGLDEGIPVPQLTPPVSPSAWTLPELIFQVGLPVPDDANHQDMAQRIQEWRNLFGANQIPDGKVTEAVFREWINHSPRRLANERDTLLSTCAGERPRVIQRLPVRALTLHPHRTKRGHLNQLLEKLTDGQGPVIGPTWTTGKDRDLVLALVHGPTSAGAFSSGGVITVALGENTRVFVKPVDPAAQQGTNAIDLAPHELPEFWPEGVRPSSQTVGTILHELSHALGLGDEYGADGFAFPNSFRRFHTQDGNLQPERELEATPNAGDLDGNKLRWDWPRIKKAGVLTERPVLITQGPPREYIIPLRIGHKLFFNDGDQVFLRQRPLLKPSLKAQPDQINPAIVSGPFDVIDTVQLPEQIIVRDSAGALNPADFPVNPNEEPIVYAPHAAQPDDDDAKLVAKVIRKHITDFKLPLNRKDAGEKCTRDDNVEQAATNTPPNLNLPSLWMPRSWLVGAFDGGATFFCAIYHPAGECMMRSSSEAGEGDLRRLCAVCRYLLVDRVDPSLHEIIDKAYSDIYPTK